MEPLFNMARCYELTPEIKSVPPARCLNCEDLGPCRAYVKLAIKKEWI